MSISYEAALACKFPFFFFSKGQNLEARFQTAVWTSKARYFFVQSSVFSVYQQFTMIDFARREIVRLPHQYHHACSRVQFLEELEFVVKY